jgi:choice-of-anchor B domain-containing protein
MLRIFTTLFTCTLFVQGFAQNVNLTFRANLTFPGQTLANICGYKDASGNEYALCGGSQGLIIVDVTNPSSPVIRTTIPEVNNLWKEIKVFRDIAYVTTEGGGGLHIINLAPLPSTTLPSQYYTGDGPINGQLNKIHALHVDTTKEFLYLFGGDFGAGGAVVCDLSADPYNPTYVGRWNVNYIHDGYVDNDTLYGAHIYAGHFSVIDFTNKTSPVLLQTQMTPGAFTHNTWLTNDRDHSGH